MQTFRECERNLPWLTNDFATCASPQIYADLVCNVGTSTGLVMKQGASPVLMFGGGHLQIRHNAAIYASSEMPCPTSLQVVDALVVLPLDETQTAPAYLPNLVVTRRQDSVVVQTQSDSDENVLWWRSSQLDLMNVNCNALACNGSGDPGNCGDGCHQNSSNEEVVGLLWLTISGAASRWGRTDYETRIRVKRRLKEREALFLLTQYVSGCIYNGGGDWEIRRNVYLRYAVR